MGTIIVSPGALMDYADWVRPKVLRVDTDAYDSAISAYLSASPNDFGGGGITNASTSVAAEVEDVEQHNLVAEQFAEAVDSLDNAYRDNGTVTFRLDHATFVALRAAWSVLGDGEDLVEQAEDIQAVQYANDINDVLADDDGNSEDKRAEVARLLAEMEADGIGDDPSAQGAFVMTLGARGLTALSDAAAFAESNGGDSWLGPITQVSAYVATTANRLSASELRDFVGEMPGSVLFMNARLTPWDNDATTIAVERLWGQDDWPMVAATWPPSFVDTLGQGDGMANWDMLPTTWRAAAAGLLADNPEVAHDFLTATSDEGRERLRDMVYNVDHAFAGDALTVGLRDYPGSLFDAGDQQGEGSLAFQQACAETEDAFAWLIDHHETTDNGLFNNEDDMTDPSRVALAHVGGMFNNDLAIIAESQGAGVGAFGTVSRADLVMFYDQLFDSTDAQQVVATQLGTYTAVTWTEAVNEFRDDPASPGLQELGGQTLKVDQLSDVFTDALHADTDDAAERASFWVGVGKSTGGALTSLGIAASPLTGGASAVAGAAAGWGMSELAATIPIPEFDAAAHAVGERQQASQTAIQVLLANPDVLDQFHDPDGARTAYNLPQDSIDLLRGDEIWEDLRSSDDATRNQAIATITEITQDNPLFGDAVADLTGELRWANEGE